MAAWHGMQRGTGNTGKSSLFIVLDALEQSSDENGWAHLGTFGSYLTKLQLDFDSRLYGYKKLSDLVKAKTDLFITEERTAPGQTVKNLYVRAK